MGVDAGYAKLNGLVLLEGGGAAAPTLPPTDDALDLIIAKADGGYHPREKAFLERVAQIFGFDEASFRRIEATFTGTEQVDPYQVLGAERSISDADLKARYRKLVRENHPDALTAQGMPKEFVDLANEKLAAINAAYDSIRKERGIP